MSFYETLLFLHLLAAFTTVTAVALFTAMFVATARSSVTGRSPLLRLSPLAEALWAVGGLTVIVFGIWLAIYVDGYAVWDGWVLAAIALWVVASATGGRVARGYKLLRRGAGERAPLLLHAAVVLAVALLLADMIWKPGA